MSVTSFRSRKPISIVVFLLVFSFLTIGCAENEKTTEVTQPGELLEKNIDKRNGEFNATFSTLDTNHTPKTITFSLNKNAWNLLEKDKLYSLHYVFKHQSKKYSLKEISFSNVTLEDFRETVEEY
ncbi:hypothetical protein [Radiobacillus deserti]|uniref:Uncharacterized protein n=1 Tax=Radiobacillus deserti TaxID=2594883 RepID=A0A516KJE1_9BACI|nr:hypothetical protein [Radiobacillus deserti]QDP41513.1 hypothetical protein FN924_15835 [Radiobacillus deserti]